MVRRLSGLSPTNSWGDSLFGVADFSAGGFIQRMHVLQQPFIKTQGRKNVRLFLADEYLVLQPEAANADFPRIRFDAEEHVPLQRDYGIWAEIGNPRRLPWIYPRTVPAGEII